MSSSTIHRRRSHSASNLSSPGHRRKLHDESWRGANKRTLSRTSPDPSSPRKNRADSWRIKRRRRDSSSGSDTDSIFRRVHHTPSQINPAFACTAADFQLFPNRARPRRRPARSTSPSIEEPTKDVNSLRSDAFQELHRSVEDSGAGFVDSMREYERSRPRFATDSQHTGRRQSMSSPPSSHGDVHCSMEDVQMSKDTGAYPFTFYAHLGGSSSSFGTGTSGTTASDSEMCSSPSLPSSSSSLILCDDDDDEDEDVAIATGYADDAVSGPQLCSSDAPSSEAHQSTRSEKALAALTLAMANGAGSIQDYSSVQMHDSMFEDDSRMGELWH
ncbi:hypothetical protein CYLTODRAFT_417537 [Cylindrobasidium torrendii FP15055 ss-10]|uniref:Uncharacterized protein n=1 Tax=Cylindrobasidium torrendii FP15055 ss-10 TaxID=1314674 RepID=A0A0D7BQF2_9AGAR|nr:hypothetical protein CYLTODRAFT_417537 [Cylindrobasidium torrendii FP15055 ss-10]